MLFVLDVYSSINFFITRYPSGIYYTESVFFWLIGALGPDRTDDLCVKSTLLLPTELRRHEELFLLSYNHIYIIELIVPVVIDVCLAALKIIFKINAVRTPAIVRARI